MPTLPDHSAHNRRIQINQAGAWGNMLRFRQGSPEVSRQHVNDIEAAAVELACLAGEGVTLRVVDETGKPLRYWSVEGGWTQAGARA